MKKLAPLLLATGLMMTGCPKNDPQRHLSSNNQQISLQKNEKKWTPQELKMELYKELKNVDDCPTFRRKLFQILKEWSITNCLTSKCDIGTRCESQRRGISVVIEDKNQCRPVGKRRLFRVGISYTDSMYEKNLDAFCDGEWK